MEEAIREGVVMEGETREGAMKEGLTMEEPKMGNWDVDLRRMSRGGAVSGEGTGSYEA